MTLAKQEKTNTAKQKATKQTTKHTNTNNQRQVSLVVKQVVKKRETSEALMC